MRIKRLELSNFKNLRDFTIDFDPKSFTTVIVGENGAGKSNVLEALIIIFRDLDLGRPPLFPYRLVYLCRKHEIDIKANPSALAREQLQILVDGQSVSFNKFTSSGRDVYLPKYVFGYYSGPSNRMEEHFEPHQRRFYEALLRGEDKPLRPLLYARHVHSQFVLMSFFSEEDQEILTFLNKQLRIEDLDSVLFVLHKPPWNSKEGDERFWKARGIVARFLGYLYQRSLAPLRLNQRVQVDFRQESTLEHLYLYLSKKELLQGLAREYLSSQEFFKALESTYISKLLSEVRVRVKIRNADNSLTFRELSEGEQQLLMVLGLLRFTKEDESLFLLDEPDTHLNPAWSINYIDYLKQVVGEEPTSQILMTTHDPLVIASLEIKDVRILELNRETDHIQVVPPEESPLNMGYADILTSDLFKLRSTVNPHMQKLLDDKRALAVKDDLTEEEEERLAKLNQQLADFDSSSNVRDPLYKPFIKAMTQAEIAEDLQSTVLSRSEQNRRQELARQIIQRLKAQEKSLP